MVATDISDGQRVFDELEKIIQVTAALWVYLEEEDEWKLVIVSPDVSERGPIKLYTRIAVLLNDLSTDPQKPVQSEGRRGRRPRSLRLAAGGTAPLCADFQQTSGT